MSPARSIHRRDRSATFQSSRSLENSNDRYSAWHFRSPIQPLSILSPASYPRSVSCASLETGVQLLIKVINSLKQFIELWIASSGLTEQLNLVLLKETLDISYAVFCLKKKNHVRSSEDIPKATISICNVQ